MNAKKPTLYLETTVPSYYVSRPSTDLLLLTHQRITREWWDNHIAAYEVFVSEVVYEEIARGDPAAAIRRGEVISQFQILEVTDEAAAFAQALLKELPLPQKALTDALHLAVASVHGVDYLATWNCRHIARGSVKKRMPTIAATWGLPSPTICTPEELLYEDPSMDRPDSG